jgi:uncharacterized protein YbjT (DUF2867 family)
MIVITAPTSNIGSQVLQNVLDNGLPVRVIARDPSRLPSAIRDRVEAVQGSHSDINVLNQAFASAETVFWLVPPDPSAKSVDAAYVDFSRPACEAIKSHRVRRLVAVSALGCCRSSLSARVRKLVSNNLPHLLGCNRLFSGA